MTESGEDSGSIEYYNQHAGEFTAATLQADMTSLYAPFLALLPPGARILDAGCGSGRDSRHFLSLGCRVTAFDGSLEMARRASELAGIPVLCLKFDEVAFVEEFDGVWASASLLHVPLPEMDAVIERLARALVPGGIFDLSVKYGEGERVMGGRHFTYFTEDSFRQALARHAELAEVQIWKSPDVRPAHREEFWLNAILRKG